MKKINKNKNSKKRNATINKIFEEMKYTEEHLKRWNISWLEQCSDAYSMDLYYLSRNNLSKVQALEEKYHNQFKLLDEYKLETEADKLSIRTGEPLKKVILYDEEDNDYICEFGIIKWYEASSNKTKRNFLFKNNGDIEYSQESKNTKNTHTKIDYNAKYNVNSNDLDISFNIDNNNLQAIIHDNIQYITYNNFSVEINMVDGSKKISYNGEKHQNQSISFEIVLYKDGNIKSKSIQIKNYDHNNQVNSIYNFKYQKNNLIEAIYINKQGKEFDMLINPELTELANNILSTFYINYPFFNKNKEELNNSIESIKEHLYKAIKSIKGDVPLFGLSRILDITLSKINTKIEKIETKQRTLKKESKKH